MILHDMLKPTDPDVLTAQQVAAEYGIRIETVYRKAGAGELPGFRVGGQWRFRRSEIEAFNRRNP